MKSMKPSKFCFDLDGTLCYTRQEGEHYRDVKPIPGAIETLQRLKKEGHYIIILTARNMVTHNSNMGKIIAHQSPIVIEWLNRHRIPYDELHFGKPVADYYVDDKAVRLTGLDTFNKDLENLQ